MRLMVYNRWDTFTTHERAFALLERIGDGTDLYDYYYWSVGVGAADLPAAARLIGAPEIAQLLERANALFPPSCIQAGTDGGSTSVYLDEHVVDFQPVEAQFEKLNAAGRGLQSALARFARLHLDEFPELEGVPE